MAYSDKVKGRFDYIVSTLGTDYLHGSHGELRYNCPFCEAEGDDHNDHKLYVNYIKGKYFCFRCEAKGAIKFDDILMSGSNSEGGVATLLEVLDNLGKEEEVAQEEESDFFLIPRTVPIPGTVAWDYIISRGISPVDISYYDIRVASINDKGFFGRFIIPNVVYNGIWTDMYTARTYVNDKIRYKNPPSSKRNDLVFNLHRIPQNPDRIIINEGQVNSIIAGTDSVATFGKYVSDNQLKMILAKNPKKVYVSLDTDARDKAEKLCERIVSLSDSQCEVYLVELPDGKDAADLGRVLYQYYLSIATRFTNKSMYFIENLFNKMARE